MPGCCQYISFHPIISVAVSPTDLLVKIEVRQGQLDCFSNLLLLHVQPTNICVRNIGLLMCAKHGNRRVGFWGENVNEGVGVTVESDRGRGLQLLAVECGENTDDVVRACR